MSIAARDAGGRGFRSTGRQRYIFGRAERGDRVLVRAIGGIIAAGVLSCAATGVQAEDWYAFYMKPQGVAYVDKDSIIRRPGQVSAKVQSSFPQPERLVKAGQVFIYSKAIEMIDVDCKARVYRYLERDLMNDAGQEQTTVSDPDHVLPIVDGTPQDVLAKAFCPRP